MFDKYEQVSQIRQLLTMNSNNNTDTSRGNTSTHSNVGGTDHTPAGRSQGLGNKLKGGVEAIHGVGEYIRGTALGTIDNVTNSGTKNVEIAERGRAETEQGMAKLDGSHGTAVQNSGTRGAAAGGAAPGMRADHGGAGQGYNPSQATDRQYVPSQQQQFQSGAPTSGYGNEQETRQNTNYEQSAHPRVNGGGARGGYVGEQSAPSQQRQN